MLIFPTASSFSVILYLHFLHCVTCLFAKWLASVACLCCCLTVALSWLNHAKHVVNTTSQVLTTKGSTQLPFKGNSRSGNHRRPLNDIITILQSRYNITIFVSIMILRYVTFFFFNCKLHPQRKTLVLSVKIKFSLCSSHMSLSFLLK